MFDSGPLLPAVNQSGPAACLTAPAYPASPAEPGPTSPAGPGPVVRDTQNAAMESIPSLVPV